MQRILRILTGLIFIFSGITKLISLDHFELYIYSFKIFSLNISFIISRLIISIEFILGLLLIIGLYRKKVWWLTMGLLVAFSIFLLVLLLLGYSGNCNCFGEVLKMEPLESLIKNIILIIPLLFLLNQKPYKLRWEKWILAGVILGGLSSPFILSPPDFFLYDKAKTKNQNFNLSSLTEEGKKKLTTYDNPSLFEGKKIICFFSTGCPYCKMAAQKISILAQKNHLEDKLVYIFCNEEEKINSFFKESQSARHNYLVIPVKDLLRITHGSIPKIFLVEDGEIQTIFNYRSLSENKVIGFFNKQDTENKK